MALLVLAVTYLGNKFILLDYDLSRDEQMANFDATIFAHGRLVWSLPEMWRGGADVLNLLFVSPAAGSSAWVSSYLPMNAAIRAAMGLVADRALTGPIYNALSLLLLWSCARRLWPQDREAATVAMLLFALSGQFLFAGMTAFAMPAHLFFNLLWFRLFLAERGAADIAALAAAFVATGLHQPLFHPLFAAPFLLLLLRERNWRRLAVFVAGYAVIAAFWLLWPQIVQDAAAQGAVVGGGAGTSLDLREGLAGHLVQLAGTVTLDGGNIVFTMENLLRFCTWQHLLLPPLLLAGWSAVRTDRMAAAIGLSLLAPAVLMAVIVPWQGNGFGYRYLHGTLGSAVLLAGYGWQRLRGCHERLRPIFWWATAASAGLVLPLQAWMAHGYYAPSAQASARIDASGADYAVIGTDQDLITRDLVLNRPDLSNRPIRLLSNEIKDIGRFAAQICRPGVTVALSTEPFLRPVIAHYGSLDFRTMREAMPMLQAGFERAGCRTLLLR